MRVLLIVVLLAFNAIAQPVEDNSPLAFLLAAKSAVEAGQWSEAREALEGAETRILTRSERPSQAGKPSRQQVVTKIFMLRQTLQAKQREAALSVISALLVDITADGKPD